MKSKKIQWHSFSFAVSQDIKRIGWSLREEWKTLKIYFSVSNYILKTSYGDYVDNGWLLQWDYKQGGGSQIGGVENCQKPLNALVEEIQQSKKISWGVKLFLNPILSIMLWVPNLRTKILWHHRSVFIKSF